MDVQKRKDLILSGDIYKVLITLAIPIMINNFIQCFYNLADSFWVSIIGSVEFAATSFVWPVDFLFISIGTGISIAGTALLSRLIGRNKLKDTSNYSTQLFAVSILAAIVFTFFGVLLTPFIVKCMGATGDLAYYSNIYLSITLLCMPFTFYYFVFNSIMVAQGNTMLPTILSAISAIANIILDPIFIFTFDLGIAGAAYATLLSKVILCIMAFIILKRSKSPLKPCFKNFKFDFHIIKKIIKIALPASIGQSGSALGFMVLTGSIASYGTSTLAAFGMVNRITSLITQPAMGFGSALVTVTGQNLGSGQISRVKEAFKKASIITITITIIGSIILLVNNETVINFFMQSKDDMKVIEEGITYLNYILFSMPLMGLFSILQGIFQGSGKTKYSMNMEIGRLWLVRLPMILLFKYFTDIGSVGIWFSMSFSNLIICIYGYYIYKKGKWELKY
ncbi:MAG: MATE family efflux transporter [Clostridium sp.]